MMKEKIFNYSASDIKVLENRINENKFRPQENMGIKHDKTMEV